MLSDAIKEKIALYENDHKVIENKLTFAMELVKDLSTYFQNNGFSTTFGEKSFTFPSVIISPSVQLTTDENSYYLPDDDCIYLSIYNMRPERDTMIELVKTVSHEMVHAVQHHLSEIDNPDYIEFANIHLDQMEKYRYFDVADTEKRSEAAELSHMYYMLSFVERDAFTFMYQVLSDTFPDTHIENYYLDEEKTAMERFGLADKQEFYKSLDEATQCFVNKHNYSSSLAANIAYDLKVIKKYREIPSDKTFNKLCYTDYRSDFLRKRGYDFIPPKFQEFTVDKMVNETKEMMNAMKNYSSDVLFSDTNIKNTIIALETALYYDFDDIKNELTEYMEENDGLNKINQFFIKMRDIGIDDMLAESYKVISESFPEHINYIPEYIQYNEEHVLE